MRKICAVLYFLLLLLNESKPKTMRRIMLCFLFLPYVNAHFIMLLNTLYIELFLYFIFSCVSLIWGFLMLLPFPYQITHNFQPDSTRKHKKNKTKLQICVSRLRSMPIEVMVCLCCVTAVEVMLRWHDIKNLRTSITLWMKRLI